MQEANGIIPEENGFFEYTKCYGYVDEEYEEAFFLENLNTQQFETADSRTDPITIDHARLVLSRLGKFHALSLALKTKNPEKFQNFVKNVPEVFLGNRMSSLFVNGLKSKVEGVLNDSDTEIKAKLNEAFGDSYLAGARRLVDGTAAEPYSVICHGDLKTTNFMFKFDEVRSSILFSFISNMVNNKKNFTESKTNRYSLL